MSLFISFEGIDGSGKTTQVRMLLAYLRRRRYDAVSFREPGGTELGEQLRSILKERAGTMSATTQMFLYEAARADLVERAIRPALQKGMIVIVDRYVDSSTAYQTALKDARVGHEPIEQINAIATGSLMPSITFLLDVRREVAKERLARRGIGDSYDTADERYMLMVHRGYMQIAKRYPRRVKIVDANRSAKQTHEVIVNHLRSRLPVRGAVWPTTKR